MFTILAADKALRLGFGPGIAVVMGVITGIGGGIIRDLLVGAPTILLRRELYMTPIIVGGALYVGAGYFVDVPQLYISWLAMAAIVAVRFGAIRWNWAFPDWLTYRPLRKD